MSLSIAETCNMLLWLTHFLRASGGRKYREKLLSFFYLVYILKLTWHPFRAAHFNQKRQYIRLCHCMGFCHLCLATTSCYMVINQSQRKKYLSKFEDGLSCLDATIAQCEQQFWIILLKNIAAHQHLLTIQQCSCHVNGHVLESWHLRCIVYIVEKCMLHNNYKILRIRSNCVHSCVPILVYSHVALVLRSLYLGLAQCKKKL